MVRMAGMEKTDQCDDRHERVARHMAGENPAPGSPFSIGQLDVVLGKGVDRR